MIKASQSDNASTDYPESVGRNMESWAKDTQAQALRLELADESCYLFPYAHLIFASLERSDNEELLRVSFTTHEIHIHGRNLRSLALAVQKLSVDWIRELPSRYQELAIPDGTLATKIKVKVSVAEAE